MVKLPRKFKLKMFITEEEPTVGHLGWACYYRVTEEDITASENIPEDVKKNLHIYAFRRSDDGECTASIEPTVMVNFDGSFVTTEDLFASFGPDDDKYFTIREIVDIKSTNMLYVNPIKTSKSAKAPANK